MFEQSLMEKFRLLDSPLVRLGVLIREQRMSVVQVRSRLHQLQHCLLWDMKIKAMQNLRN